MARYQNEKLHPALAAALWGVHFYDEVVKIPILGRTVETTLSFGIRATVFAVTATAVVGDAVGAMAADAARAVLFRHPKKSWSPPTLDK